MLKAQTLFCSTPRWPTLDIYLDNLQRHSHVVYTHMKETNSPGQKFNKYNFPNRFLFSIAKPKKKKDLQPKV